MSEFPIAVTAVSAYSRCNDRYEHHDHHRHHDRRNFPRPRSYPSISELHVKCKICGVRAFIEKQLSLYTMSPNKDPAIQKYIKTLSESIDKAVDNCRLQTIVNQFYTPTRPDISTSEFIARCVTYFKCSKPCLVLAVIYVDRLLSYNMVCITDSNKCNLFSTALVIAVKIHDDHFYKNSFYAKVAGVSVNDLNSLELELCTYLDFNLFVDTWVFYQYESYLLALP